MPPDVDGRRDMLASAAPWLLAMTLWSVALAAWPDLPRLVVQATRLAALYVVGRS